MKYLVLLFALASCAAPAASQGNAGQGGSATSPIYNITVNVGSDKGTITVTSAPTAAPSAASEAASTQTATNDIKPDVTIPAGGIPTLGGTTVKKPKPEPAPAPAPVPGENP